MSNDTGKQWAPSTDGPQPVCTDRRTYCMLVSDGTKWRSVYGPNRRVCIQTASWAADIANERAELRAEVERLRAANSNLRASWDDGCPCADPINLCKRHNQAMKAITNGEKA
jgi:hypothetical protein